MSNRRQTESHQARLNGRGAKEEGNAKGCGCQTGILRWFRPPYAKLFYAACCIHDDDYDRGGGKQDRRTADRLLFANCMKRIGQCKFAPMKATWMVFVALCYYGSVRVLGGSYFKYN